MSRDIDHWNYHATAPDGTEYPFIMLHAMRRYFIDDPGISIGHITVLHNDNIILLSGFKGYKANSAAFYRASNEIWVYDQVIGKWYKRESKAEVDDDDMPLERSCACATIIDNNLYMFGGFSEEGNLNTLYRLNLKTLKWRRMKPTGIEPLQCDKNVGWEYDGKFYFFGGYGPVPRIWNEDFTFQFIFDTSSHWHYIRGWNNQLACYNPVENCWEWPTHSGHIPPARAAFAASKVDHHLYLFGGRLNQERMNDMYVLDMRTLHWTQIQQNTIDNAVEGRSWHTLTQLSDHFLVLYGGLSNNSLPLNDCWIFDIRSYTWREITLPFNKPRFWHSATLSSMGELLVVGGATKKFNGSFIRNIVYNHIFARDLITIIFQPKSLFRICLDTIVDELPLTRRLFCMLPFNIADIIVKRYIRKIHKSKIDYSETDISLEDNKATMLEYVNNNEELNEELNE